MNSSRQIAGLLGPTMVAFGASEAFTYRIWAANVPPLIALNGLLLFVTGLAIVRAHNLRQPVPDVRAEFQQAGENAPTTIAAAIAVGVIGVVLTVNGYRRKPVETTDARSRAT